MSEQHDAHCWMTFTNGERWHILRVLSVAPHRWTVVCWRRETPFALTPFDIDNPADFDDLAVFDVEPAP